MNGKPRKHFWLKYVNKTEAGKRDTAGVWNGLIRKIRQFVQVRTLSHRLGVYCWFRRETCKRVVDFRGRLRCDAMTRLCRWYTPLWRHDNDGGCLRIARWCQTCKYCYRNTKNMLIQLQGKKKTQETKIKANKYQKLGIDLSKGPCCHKFRVRFHTEMKSVSQGREGLGPVLVGNGQNHRIFLLLIAGRLNNSGERSVSPQKVFFRNRVALALVTRWRFTNKLYQPYMSIDWYLCSCVHLYIMIKKAWRLLLHETAVATTYWVVCWMFFGKLPSGWALFLGWSIRNRLHHD